MRTTKKFLVCENCGKKLTDNSLPYCHKCLVRLAQWGDNNTKSRIYNLTHREERKQYRNGWQQKNKEAVLAYNKLYYHRNKELMKEKASISLELLLLNDLLRIKVIDKEIYDKAVAKINASKDQAA